jgi:NhaA family Na+:H+ antiporter
VIALFYTAELSTDALVTAAAVLLVLVLANRAGVRHPGVYALMGLALWLAVLSSGVHATIAGVLLALTIPSRTRLDARQFLHRARGALEDFARSSAGSGSVLTNEAQQEALQRLEHACEQAQAPLLKLEEKLHVPVAFLVMPIFALANAGVRLESDAAALLADPISLGVIAGLTIGKPLGITLVAWLAVALGLAARPAGVTWRAVLATGWLAGIGFTMSIFIAGLAFASAEALTAAKLGILAASLLAGGIGYTLMRLATPTPSADQ